MGRRGVTIGLRYIDRFTDRHGHTRLYFRRPGGARIPLPGVDDPGFMAAYQAALSAEAPKPAKPARGAPGTFDRLIQDYYGSPGFLRTKESSRTVTRGILDRFCEEHGSRRVDQFQRKHVEAIIGAKAATPAAANSLLKKLRAVIAFAIRNNWRTDDPTAKMQKFREGTHHTWTEEEIAAFCRRWPVGTCQRTAFALALYTGQRRADVARMTWRSYDPAARMIEVVQEKGDMERRDEKLAIPVHRDLAAALAAWPRSQMVILVTGYGRAFSIAGFGNFMADAIAAAGLPDRCVLHGLRKAAARRLAEAGCSARQIMAVTGHRSLEEAERYTVRAAQRVLAADALAKLEQFTRRNE